MNPSRIQKFIQKRSETKGTTYYKMLKRKHKCKFSGPGLGNGFVAMTLQV